MLYNQYEGEKEQLQSELDGYRTEPTPEEMEEMRKKEARKDKTI